MSLSIQQIEKLARALLVRSGVIQDKVVAEEVARGEYAEINFIRALNAVLAGEGVNVESLSPYETARSVMDAFHKKLDPNRSPQMISSSGLNSLLNNTVQTALRIGFTSAKTSYQYLSTPRGVKDLKSCDLRSLSELSTALEIPEGTPPKLASISDRLDRAKLKSYGLSVLLTEAAIVNDQLDIATSCVAAIGRSIATCLNRLYWSNLLANQIMSEDNTPLFTAAHGNLLPAAALTEASLQTAVAAMLAQRLAAPGQPGEVGGIRPVYLACDPSNMQVALRLTGANYQPLSGWRLIPIVEPLIPTGVWLLFADPIEVDFAANCYLNGRPEPTSCVRIGAPGQAQGIYLDGQHYAAEIFTDYRAVVKVG